jgi:hypothetical protein
MLATVNLSIVDVYWDAVFYKTMAFGLADISTFELKRHIPVPILYPWFLSLGCHASSYEMVEWIHSWMNPAIYCCGLFPLYRLSRFFLDARSSVATCLLYLVYPASIYTQWTVSENLAIPLTLFAGAYSAAILVDDQSFRWNGILLGIILAALALTRIQSLVIVLVILGWLWFRLRRMNACLLSWFQAGLIFFVLVALVWFGLGYVSWKGVFVIYSNVNHEQVHGIGAILGTFVNRFVTHWTALWLEGALLIPPLALFLLFRSFIFQEWESRPRNEIMLLLFIISLVIVVSIAAYRVLRAGLEPWSVSLRHVCYVNYLFLPLAVSAMGQCNRFPFTEIIKRWLLLLALTAVLGIGFFCSEAWEGLTHNFRFFSNSPSLDFMQQLSNTAPWLADLFLLVLAAVLGLGCLYSRRWGIVLLTGLLFYIQASAFDYMYEDQSYSIRVMNVKGIHDFCAQLDAGRWKQIPIFCHEDHRVQYLVPNLLYWVYRRSNVLPNESSRPQLPYLFLTFNEQEEGELVFLSGKLRAYFYK